jgi:hypothetical protein
MKTRLKQQLQRVVLGGAAAALLAHGAPALAFPASGTCAMLVTQPVPYGATVPHSSGYNILATFTFTGTGGGTINYAFVRATYAATGATPAGTTSNWDIPFALTDGPIPGSKTFSFVGGGVGTVHGNMYAVNGDRTILVQGANHLFSGVCQF